MPSYCWKIKVLKSTGSFAQGMEVEVIKHNTTGSPNEKEIKEAFELKYKIKPPSGIYGNKHIFEIKKPF